MFCLIIPVLFSYYVYDSYGVMEVLNNKPKLDEYYYRVLKRSFVLSLEDLYAFTDIAINPPQPDFDQNYHQKFDVQQTIKDINHTDTDLTLYQLYRKIRNIIADLKDPSIFIETKYKILQTLSDLYLACPIDFVIKKTDKPELFITYNEQFIKIFDQKVADEIKENLDSAIVSINDKDPFDFIANFGGNIESSKNPHGTVSRKFNNHNGQTLSSYPIGEEYLNMIINFKNGKKLNITYAFVSNNKIQDFNNTIIKQVEGTIEQKKYNAEEVKEIGWDEGNDSDSFKCKVDNQNQVNIIYSKNLDPNTDFNKCLNLIDNNNYPIIFIFGKYEKFDAFKDSNPNNVNSINTPKLLIESISPLKSVKYYMADKIHEFSLKKIPVEIAEKVTSFFAEPIDIGYGLNEEMIKRKNSLKNKRKPTDILIYTDGTLLSMSSLFMKIFQYYGAGIVAGYFGNPNKKNIPFDSAQSSSLYKDQKRLLVRSSRGAKELYKRYNTYLEIPTIQFFSADMDFKKPLEYSVTPVDEIVDIFQYLKGSTYYQSFVDEAKRIFEKYKTQCNPYNKRLVFVTDECNNKFENGYTHGGFECGDDGKWTNKCVPSYCDAGYVFNYKTYKCDSIMDKIDFSNIIVTHIVPVHEKSSLNFKTIFPIFSVICIFGAIIYYEYMRKNKKIEKENENENCEELINIETK